MNFDTILMNPPYQSSKLKEHEGRGKCGTSLWESFVEKSLSIVKENSFICNIHPSRWRKPKSKVGRVIRSKQILYLEMHGLEDGMKTFGCQSRYDWYVLKNALCKDKTTIMDQNGDISNFSICKMPFIPNAQIKKIMSLVAKDGEEKVELLYSASAYDHRKKWMSKEKKGKFKYPCVYSINKNGNIKCYYSSKKDNGFFDIPKVIFPSGAFQSVKSIVDENGEYGLTEFAKGIVDTPPNLNKICDVLNSDKFKEFYKAITMGTTELDKNIIKYFKKDWWREFI